MPTPLYDVRSVQDFRGVSLLFRVEGCMKTVLAGTYSFQAMALCPRWSARCCARKMLRFGEGHRAIAVFFRSGRPA